MRILLVGEKGQLAQALISQLSPLAELVIVDYPDFDLGNRTQASSIVKKTRPDLAINAAAFTNVDLAEKEREQAMAINGNGPGWLAAGCHGSQVPLIHYSTDFVFNGKKGFPYTEKDAPAPLNMYGVSKLRGEETVFESAQAAIVFRLAWLYSKDGQSSFVHKLQQWAKKNETLTIVDDQIGNPTWAGFVADATSKVILQAKDSGKNLFRWFSENAGIYHLTSGGCASRYEWAEEILKLVPNKTDFKVKHLFRGKTEDFPAPAKRPAYSALDCSRFEHKFGITVDDWQTQLRRCMTE